MTLAELLARNPGIGLLSRDDNAEICRFFDEKPMEGGGFRLRFVRGPDFFRFLRCQGDEAFVFCIRDGQGELSAVGTVSLRRGYIEGRAETCAYLGDLRVRPNRQNVRVWRRFLADLVRSAPGIDEFRGCRRFLTAILAENQVALRSLVGSDRHGFAYRRLDGYRMVNLIGRKPWTGRSALASQVRRSTRADLPRISEFLAREHAGRPFGYVFDQGELERRMETWTGLGPESFYLLEDRGRIVGCFAPWSPSPAKRIVVDAAPWAFGALRWIPGLAVPPTAGREMRVVYATHLAVTGNRAEGLAALLDAYWPEHESGAFFSICDFDSASMQAAWRAYGSQTTRLVAFTVSPADSEEPRWNLDSGLGLEMALI